MFKEKLSKMSKELMGVLYLINNFWWNFWNRIKWYGSFLGMFFRKFENCWSVCDKYFCICLMEFLWDYDMEIGRKKIGEILV